MKTSKILLVAAAVALVQESKAEGVESPCVRPGSHTGYTFSTGTAPTETHLEPCWFKVTGWTCDTANGYYGTAEAVSCTEDGGYYSLRGCHAKCKVPSSHRGYTVVSYPGSDELRMDAFYFWKVRCDTTDGYTGWATVTACTAANGDVGFSGCVPSKCTRPTTAGYTWGTIVGTETPASFGVTGGITCNTAAGYSGTPVAAVGSCTADNVAAGTDYSVTGCTLTDCIRPTGTTVVTYVFTSATETLTKASFAATGIKCLTATGVTGYHKTGTTAVTGIDGVECSAAGAVYSVTGCIENKCVLGTLDATKYVTTGCDTTGGAKYASECTLSCATGYSGTPSVTCYTAGLAGTFANVGSCVAVVTPTTCVQPTTDGYYFSETQLAISGFSVSVTCKSGWFHSGADTNVVSTPAAVVCSANGAAYSVSGCEKLCQRPTDMRYDFGSVQEDSRKRTSFSVRKVKCNEGCGYGNVAATTVSGYRYANVAACATGGGDYVVSGCVAVACRTPKERVCGTWCSNSPPRGYTLDATWKETKLLTCGFDVTGGTCDSTKGYTGTPAYSVCSAAGHPYVASGCSATKCAERSQWTSNPIKVVTAYHPGYFDTIGTVAGTSVQETNLATSGISLTGLRCYYEDGWVGTAAPACSTGGKHYTFSGCQPYKGCRPPTSTLGYDLTNVGGSFEPATFALTGITCHTSLGYTGTAAAAIGSCTVDNVKTQTGRFTLSGCTDTKDFCYRPTNAQYDFSGVTENLDRASFSVTGLQCNAATGYTGTATNTICAAASPYGAAYNVAGCVATRCATPTSHVGYVISGATCTAPCSPDHFAVSGLTCASGYTGTPTASPCSTVGYQWSLHGCVADCVKPAFWSRIGVSLVTDRNVHHSMTHNKFAVTAQCDFKCGYTGFADIHRCSAGGGQYSLSGTCKSGGCTTPTTPGYIYTNQAGLCMPGGCAIAATIQCDFNADYAGTPVTTACASAGTPYVVTGCAIPPSKTITKIVDASGNVVGCQDETGKVVDCEAALPGGNVSTAKKGTTSLAAPEGPSAFIIMMTSTMLLRMLA